MTTFEHLQKVMPDIEDAAEAFDISLIHVTDDLRVIAATAAFNKVLRRAAAALLRDLHDRSAARQWLAEWRPVRDTETWFGPDPVTYLRHVLRDQLLHRMGLPGTLALR